MVDKPTTLQGELSQCRLEKAEANDALDQVRRQLATRTTELQTAAGDIYRLRLRVRKYRQHLDEVTESLFQEVGDRPDVRRAQEFLDSDIDGDGG